MPVRLATGPNELQLYITALHLRRTIRLEHTQMRTLQTLVNSLSQTDTRAYCHYVNVLRRAVQQQITHPPAYDITFHAKPIRFLTYQVQGFIFEFWV